jgi:hypothetical protein
MLQTVKGVYRNGKIELTEIPQNILESQVLITFIETTTPENIVVKSRHLRKLNMRDLQPL